MTDRTDRPTTTAREVVIERIFDAPPELVWKAWSDPKMVTHWWGPKGFAAPFAELDFRVGGKWLFAMQSPDYNDGKPLWSTGEYKEIVPFERIVLTDCFADEKGNVVPASHYGLDAEVALETLITVTFEDLGGKTKLTLRHEGLGEMGEGASEGWSESLDKMAASLAG
jgi:uncharacterized protein YndB with AHSA1/START domain